MSPEKFVVKVMEGEVVSDFTVDPDGGNELSKMIMRSIRANRRAIDEIWLERKFAKRGRRRRSSEVRIISPDVQKRLDDLREELKVLKGEIEVPLSTIRDDEGELIGLKIGRKNNKDPSSGTTP